MNHSIFLHRCLVLAEEGRGRVGSNPLVGAVLVRDGKIIAQGAYFGPGTDHAEAALIASLQPQNDYHSVKTARRAVFAVSTNDILYINLEPCCHHGNTSPCTDAIIASGIKHVVIGMVDPDPRVAGKGIAALRKAGIEVIGPVLRAQCERFNRGYVSLRTKGRPYITLKRAQSIDGRIANIDGSKLCITSEDQNVWSHTYLRSTHDAILVGVQTVILDDPLLTIRLLADRSLYEGSNKKFDQSIPQPIVIILDPDLRIPVDARVMREGTVVVTKETDETKETKGTKETLLKRKGVTVIRVPMINGHFDWDVLWQQFSIFNFQSSISSILVEGGPKTWDAFKKAGIVDEEVILVGAECRT